VRAEEQRKVTAAARAEAERDNAKQRALVSMMNNTLEKKREDPLAHLTREPWMDLPLKQLTKAQREALREFETAVQENIEAARESRRVMEAERKLLEDEVMVAVREFNAELAGLHQARVGAEMRMALVAQIRASLCTAIEDVSTPTTVFCNVITRNGRVSALSHGRFRPVRLQSTGCSVKHRSIRT
jgi:hypothetical protein